MYSKYHEPTFHQPGLNPHILNNIYNNLYNILKLPKFTSRHRDSRVYPLTHDSDQSI
jgi:hypothetical protein